MSKTFDAILKHLVEAYPAAWAAAVGLLTDAPLRVIDADVSTVSGGADKVIRVEAANPWLFHLELQTGPDTSLVDRAHLYNTVMGYRHGLPVRTVLFLLRRQADSSRLTGLLEHTDPDGDWFRRFRYRVVRIWDVPVESVLTGGIGLLPLAPISDVEPDRLPEVIRRMDERLAAETSPPERTQLWLSTLLLMGLRYPKALAAHLLKGVPGMEEATTVQWMLDRGEVRGLKETVLKLGSRRFGPPQPRQEATVNAMTEDDLDKLKVLRDRVLDVSSWDELLAAP